MKIGISSPFNPREFEKWLYNNQEIPECHKGATSVNTYVEGLLNAGHHVTIFTSYDYDGIPKLLTGERLKIFIVSRKSKFPIKNAEVNRYLNRLYVGIRLAKIIKKEIKDLDILHGQWTYDFAFATIFFTKKIPVCCSVRDWCPYQYSIQNSKSKRIYWGISYLVFKIIMSIKHITFIANSEYTYNCIKTKYPEKNVYTIPNPIKKDYILTERYNYPQKATFISISQSLLEERKNYTNLLIAFQKYKYNHKDSKLILIGNYSKSSPKIKEWKAKSLLEGVMLLGFIGHDEIKEYLDTSTHLIHPSLEETFGNTLLEGFARRLIVIGGKNSGAVPQVLGFGKYGFLCDITSPDCICNTMEKTTNIKQHETILNNATDYLIKNYRVDVIVKNHLKLYSELQSLFKNQNAK